MSNTPMGVKLDAAQRKQAESLVESIAYDEDAQRALAYDATNMAARLRKIAEIIEEVDRRAMFGDAVTPTRLEMTDDEMRRIYAKATGREVDHE